MALFTTGGALVTSFRVTANGEIRTVALNGSHLLLGGTFTTIDGAARNGLASVSTATGALDSYLTVSLTGHHNFGRLVDAAIVDGNFTSASDFSRDQIVNIKLSATSATVDPNWATAAYTHNCQYKAYDSYVQDVAWSPTGATSSSRRPADTSPAASKTATPQRVSTPPLPASTCSPRGSTGRARIRCTRSPSRPVRCASAATTAG